VFSPISNFHTLSILVGFWFACNARDMTISLCSFCLCVMCNVCKQITLSTRFRNNQINEDLYKRVVLSKQNKKKIGCAWMVQRRNGLIFFSKLLVRSRSYIPILNSQYLRFDLFNVNFGGLIWLKKHHDIGFWYKMWDILHSMKNCWLQA